jgi:hypothetical protein
MTAEFKETNKKFNNPHINFLYGLNSPETRRKYSKRLETFFDFVGIHGNKVEERHHCKMSMRVKKST